MIRDNLEKTFAVLNRIIYCVVSNHVNYLVAENCSVNKLDFSSFNLVRLNLRAKKGN